MKPFKELEERYTQAVADAEVTLATDGRLKGEAKVAGVLYNVGWGACANEYDPGASVSIKVWPVPSPSRRAGDTVDNFHASRGDDMPEGLRAAILRGQKRLEEWQAGGPFPETAEALFAEVPVILIPDVML